MPVLAVIPARLGATRLPRKPLRLLGGQPLVLRVLDRVVGLGVADAVVVASDADEVHAAVRAHGGTSVDTREDHPSGTDRVAEVASRPEYQSFDVVLNVQGDEPFVSADVLRGAVRMCERFPLGTVAVRRGAAVLQEPSVVKVVCDASGRAMYFSRAPIPWLRDAADRAVHEPLVLQHVGVYAYRRGALQDWVQLPVHPLEQVERLEQLRPLAAGMGMGVAVLDGPLDGGIDTEDDLARANARWHDLFAGRS
ncbi:MAG: 3-deoxy-manno-octulosonate cytidylyltransferase [Gemmatimonadetes bacterium]|nr:3-deoxy-manno-octulosonate cytidylyltransferase [Gemmatimonadota bacterium]